MSAVEFRATIELNGKTATGIEVPPDVMASLDSGKRALVKVTLAGYTYRSSVASMGGRFLVPVSAEVRAASGVSAGDVVDVALELDTAPREVEVPAELADVFAAEPELKGAFDGLSFSRKRALAGPIADAKTDDTRSRRLAKAVEELRAALG